MASRSTGPPSPRSGAASATTSRSPRFARARRPTRRPTSSCCRKLEELIPKYGITGLSDVEVDWLHKVWHRLDPWPDSVEGLTRLKKKFVIATLSNGNVALLTNMAKHGGLPWDTILSAELVKKFKSEPEMYHSASQFLGLPMNQIVMSAAHLRDLYAAREQGMRTAFIRRPNEWGPNGQQEGEPEREIDVWPTDFVDLARQLGA